MIEQIKIISLLILILCSFNKSNLARSATIISVSNELDKDWWQTASLYQIYPRSFKDSNGDGIGDLNGITEKLEYLTKLGITATWLSPIFQSPMADFGYDISDFYNIQPDYGTMDDFDRLIKRANELEIKIILDFVPNHSSDENEWFKKSVNRDEGFEDFYVWHPGYEDPENATNRLPPSNWRSVFHGSSWQFNSIRNEFYLHQFLVKQPDLNYRSKKVVEAMKSVLRFWLDRGVSGFRIDAVPYLFEIKPDCNGNYHDEPISGYTNDTDDWNYLKHIYTVDQPETVDMVYQWRDVMDEYKRDYGGDTRIMLTEAYSPIEIVMQYFGNKTHEGAHIPFNFELITKLNNNSMAWDYKNIIDNWMNKMPEGRTANWVVGNHDQNRISARLGIDRIDIINMIVLTLPGISITYNGEEIGMTDVWISWNDTVDPAACNTNPQIYEKFSRDPERTPFQWDTTINAGFSTNPKTWLPVSDNYKEINVETENCTVNSHLHVYVSLMQLRHSITLKFGDLSTHVYNDNVLIIIRSLSNHPSYLTLTNIRSNIEIVDLTSLSNVTNNLLFITVSGSSLHKPGEFITKNNIVLQGKESFVLRTTK